MAVLIPFMYKNYSLKGPCSYLIGLQALFLARAFSLFLFVGLGEQATLSFDCLSM